MTSATEEAALTAAARALLEWYADAGLHDLPGDAPINRSVRPAPPERETRETTAEDRHGADRSAPGFARERPASSGGDGAYVKGSMPEFTAPSAHGRKPAAPAMLTEEESPALRARELADAAGDLNALRESVHGFKLLSICKTATNTVFSDGIPSSSLMIIGEAPGADEDAQGIPFCGASGKLLEQALNSVGLKRSENYYISNTIFWRPPANRKPTEEELETCRPFVEKHIALIRPRVLALSGGTAASALLGEKSGVTKLRGKFVPYTNRYLKDESIPALVLFHPSYLLRSPGQKRFMWRDLLTLEAKLTEG